MKITVSSRITPSRNSGSGSSSTPLRCKFLEVPHASAATETRPFGFCIFGDEKQWVRLGPPAFGTCYGARRFCATPEACPEQNVSRCSVLQAYLLYVAMAAAAHEPAGTDLYRDRRQGPHLQCNLQRERAYRLLPAGHNDRNSNHEIIHAKRKCLLCRWIYHADKLAGTIFLAAQHLCAGRGKHDHKRQYTDLRYLFCAGEFRRFRP